MWNTLCWPPAVVIKEQLKSNNYFRCVAVDQALRRTVVARLHIRFLYLLQTFKASVIWMRLNHLAAAVQS